MNSDDTISSHSVSEPRRPRVPRWAFFMMALMVASVIGVFAVGHTQATSFGQTANSAKNRVIGCTGILEQGVAVKDLPVLCTNPDIRKYYTPENVKPALTRLVEIQIAFDCDQYKAEKISPTPPVCAAIPSLADLTTGSK